jgi:hypothetical protein
VPRYPGPEAVGGGCPDVMKKTSLYIDPEVERALERRTTLEGITKAELVRRVLADAVSGRPRPRPRGVFEGPSDRGAGAKLHLSEMGFSEP